MFELISVLEYVLSLILVLEPLLELEIIEVIFNTKVEDANFVEFIFVDKVLFALFSSSFNKTIGKATARVIITTPTDIPVIILNLFLRHALETSDFVCVVVFGFSLLITSNSFTSDGLILLEDLVNILLNDLKLSH